MARLWEHDGGRAVWWQEAARVAVVAAGCAAPRKVLVPSGRCWMMMTLRPEVPRQGSLPSMRCLAPMGRLRPGLQLPARQVSPGRQ